jgi:hypothetical protein
VVITTTGTKPWSFVTHIFCKGIPRYGTAHKTFKVKLFRTKMEKGHDHVKFMLNS